MASCDLVPGALKYAHKLFDVIPKPDVSVCNNVMRGSAQSMKPEKTVSLYNDMERRDVMPDRYTYTFVLKACSKLEWRNNGFAVHGKVLRHGFVYDEYVKNALILFHANCGDLRIASQLFDDSAKAHNVAWSSMASGYAKRGKIYEAMRLFYEMPDKDQVAWNVMITGCLKCKAMDTARELFDKFTEKDVVTWNAMISGYVNCGYPKEALSIFKEMRDACMVDMLGRAGLLEEALMFVESMEVEPNAIVWRTLLGACRIYGDVELGKYVNEKLLSMRKNESGDYVLLSNIYMVQKS